MSYCSDTLKEIFLEPPGGGARDIVEDLEDALRSLDQALSSSSSSKDESVSEDGLPLSLSLGLSDAE